MELNQLYDWFMSLGEPYGVNPIIFGSIYVGAIPFFWVAMWWLVKNIRNNRSVAGPVLMACCCAVSSYVYLIFVGENVPYWVYGLIVAIIVYAIYSTLQSVKKKKSEIKEEQTPA
ncbi:hypothetical protein [Fodinibius sp.]|uniref:hypothetical protein n=1 Tax=Fodinibius sp. TaxID=1872440 RepID=UPI002ACD9E98|nr:hypothetical protein [Fodinibius sp.]MDZ7658997.1 hypothetical protein [Fodinibius sp.]